MIADASLRRSVSLPWLVLYGLGTTIGAGIHALTGSAGRSRDWVAMPKRRRDHALSV